MSAHAKETKQERRERRLKKKREQIQQHGKSLIKVYKDAVTKRAKEETLRQAQGERK